MSTMPGGFSIGQKRPQITRFSIPPILVAPKLTALSGWVLFACALAALFRILALNATHELHYPCLDFAICSIGATLGLSIARMAPSRR